MAVVEEFRATVVRCGMMFWQRGLQLTSSICGDPRQKSGSAPPPTAQNRPQSGLSNHVHQPSPAPPPTDDLTRLFAGITVVSLSESSLCWSSLMCSNRDLLPDQLVQAAGLTSLLRPKETEVTPPKSRTLNLVPRIVVQDTPQLPHQ
jgi:hypothetical protein